MTITKKGWYKEVDENTWENIDGKKYHNYRVTYRSSRGSFHGVNIHIRSSHLTRYGTFGYIVDTSGHYMYVYKRQFKTLSQAETYAKKIMKYHDYGRIKLKVVSNN
jgi:hypothetical protein